MQTPGPSEHATVTVPPRQRAAGTMSLYNGVRNSPPPRGWSRQRLLLGVLAGAVILLLVGGVGVGLVLWDRAAAPTAMVTAVVPVSGQPEVAADHYLRALLLRRDKVVARRLACGDAARLSAVEDLLDAAMDSERAAGSRVLFSWVPPATTSESTVRATVETTLSIDGAAAVERPVQRWRFGLIWDGQWRVCGGTLLASS